MRDPRVPWSSAAPACAPVRRAWTTFSELVIHHQARLVPELGDHRRGGAATVDDDPRMLRDEAAAARPDSPFVGRDGLRSFTRSVAASAPHRRSDANSRPWPIRRRGPWWMVSLEVEKRLMSAFKDLALPRKARGWHGDVGGVAMLSRSLKLCFGKRKCANQTIRRFPS